VAFRVVLHGLTVTALAVMLAMMLSARNNRLLLRGLQADLRAWHTAQADQAEPRRVALEQLKADRQQLLQYERTGVPWKQGWGLYHASVLLPVLEREIAAYRPPAPAPTLISLDSLSLFASSEARLKPDANRALVGALVEITAHPDKRVVIAGHTDNSGNPRANQALSEARASAVKDWFVAMSSLPASHFAVQGYGDSRPLVPNDSPENKARNRRVEITLVPDLPAH
jgi:outer membrane protein OmpA-like peptidoglycan-associated protein